LGAGQATCVIVGHGHSLRGMRLGRTIDKYDVVVRLSNGPVGADHGFRTDIVVAVPLEICSLVGRCARELWLYNVGFDNKIPDYGIFDDIARENVRGKIEITHIKVKVRRWLERYRELADKKVRRKHPHVIWPSKGTAAALAVKEILNPKVVFPAGFDNVMKGEKTAHCHDWSAEKQILKEAGVL